MTLELCSAVDPWASVESFAEASGALLAALDADRRFVRLGGRWGSVLGHAPEEMLDRPVEDFVHPADWPGNGRFPGPREAGPTCHRWRARDGAERWLTCLGLVSETGQILCIFQDVTDLLGQRDREHARDILGSIANPVLCVDPTFVVREANRAAVELFACADDELLGSDLQGIIPGVTHSVEHLWAQPSGNGRDRASVTLDTLGRRGDGSSLLLRISVAPSGHGSRRLLTLVAWDLTRERRDRAQQVDEARAREASAIHSKLANELHDGVLQSLAGASLQLEAIRSLFPSEPEAALSRLEALQTSLSDEQRELRFFVDEFRSGSAAWESHEAPLEERAQSLLVRVKHIWGVECRFFARIDAPPSMSRSHEVLRILHEGVVNAVRHGRATEVRVSLESGATGITIRLQDNGRGFPFRGRLQDAELKERRLGPVRLRQRVADIGGVVEIDSSAYGAVLTARLPAD